MNTHAIDLTGLKCPLPIVRIRSAMNELAPGDELRVTADDPAFCLDIVAWCDRTGNSLVSCDESDGQTVAVINKAGD